MSSKGLEPAFAEDGRRLHTIRQSTLSSYVGMCAESVRRELVDPSLNKENDAKGVGTAVHAGIEHQIEHLMVGGDYLPVDELAQISIDAFAEIERTPGYEATKWTPLAARVAIKEATRKWYEQVLPALRPAGGEVHFSKLVLYEDSERIIQASGTIDYIDQNGSVIDWKTAGREYTPWEKERWAVQPTMYLWAAQQHGLPCERFEYVVMVHGKPKVQRLALRRSEGHFAWLKRQALQYAKQVEADLDTWVLNDQGWWCSRSWCSSWMDCKGANVPDVETAGKVRAA